MSDTNEYTVHDLVRDELIQKCRYRIWKVQRFSDAGSRKHHWRADTGTSEDGKGGLHLSIGKNISMAARDDTFEEVMLQGLVLGYAKGKIEDILLYLDRFIPKIDNWSVCDCTSNTILKLQKNISRKSGNF